VLEPDPRSLGLIGRDELHAGSFKCGLKLQEGTSGPRYFTGNLKPFDGRNGHLSAFGKLALIYA
jgi:hypothetical protein